MGLVVFRIMSYLPPWRNDLVTMHLVSSISSSFEFALFIFEDNKATLLLNWFVGPNGHIPAPLMLKTLAPSRVTMEEQTVESQKFPLRSFLHVFASSIPINRARGSPPSLANPIVRQFRQVIHSNSDRCRSLGSLMWAISFILPMAFWGLF